MTTPLVCVVVPTRNRRSLLGATLRSILAQVDIDFEVVVVDDASEPGSTLDVVEALGDDRVRLVHHREHLGMSAARNTGIAAARSRWIAFCDDDDLWSPSKLASQLAALETDGARWVYTGEVVINARNDLIGGVSPASLDDFRSGKLRRNNLLPAGMSNVMVERAMLEEVGGLDPTLRHLADWDLWLRLERIGMPTVVPHPLVAYRTHETADRRDVLSILKELRAWSSRVGADVEWADVYLYYAGVARESGQSLLAFRLYARAAAGGRLVQLVRAWRNRGDRQMATEQDPWLREAATWLANAPHPNA